jgi:hypothetical protein
VFGRQAGQKTLQLPIALLHLLVGKMEVVHGLPELKYQIVAPVAVQTARYLFSAGPHHLMSQVCQFPGVALALQNGANTFCKIEMPASLRSDGVRDDPGMPLGFLSELAFSFNRSSQYNVLHHRDDPT